MAQGPIKQKAVKVPNKKSKVTKKKAAAKNGRLEGSKATRKFTAAMVGRTEKLLGERAGHLELVGKGKKTVDADKVAGKGGSKKYG